MLDHAIGRTPADSGLLTKGPIVTDLHALVGKQAIAYRQRLERGGGPLTRFGGVLFTASPPGDGAAYLIIDPQQLALEAGFKAGGRWVVERTASSQIARPPAVAALLER